MIGELAEQQHGVVARRQLEARGVSPAMVKNRVASGRLVRLHRGVYAVGHRRLRREGYWLAAVLAAGRGAALSHRDAAALHGLRPPGDHPRVEVTTPRRARSTPRIAVHRTTVLAAEDVAVRHGIRVTSVARTLVDLAGTPPFAKALEEAERLGALDVGALERALERTRNRRGPNHRAAREALAELRGAGVAFTRSSLEDAFLRLVRDAGLPRPRTNALVAGMEVDAHWPSHGVVVELDGWAYHRTTRAFQRDRDRTNDLTLAGHTVLRFTYDDVVRRPRRVAAQVAEALRYPPPP